jgi:hypothetical protein
MRTASTEATRGPRPVDPEQRQPVGGRQQAANRLDVLRARRIELDGLLVRERDALRAGRVWIDGFSSSTAATYLTLFLIVSRFLPAALRCVTSSFTSSTVSSSTRRWPSSGVTRASATRCRTRVPSLTSTREARQRSQASASVRARVSVSSEARLGTRRAACSPLTHCFRATASLFVLKLPA